MYIKVAFNHNGLSRFEGMKSNLRFRVRWKSKNVNMMFSFLPNRENLVV